MLQAAGLPPRFRGTLALPGELNPADTKALQESLPEAVTNVWVHTHRHPFLPYKDKTRYFTLIAVESEYDVKLREFAARKSPNNFEFREDKLDVTNRKDKSTIELVHRLPSLMKG
jgi:hypothetical protein